MSKPHLETGTHTPGPWVVCPGTQFEDMEPRVLANGGRHAVASVKLTGNIQKEANARLIAAAPELLEACQQALMQAEMDETTHGRKFGWGNVLRAAIAKATGAA
jgi:hypothetical protein